MTADRIGRIRKRPGDAVRWAEWYKSVYPRVYYTAFRLANGNAEEARDLAQEAFARFLDYAAIERVECEAHALSYLNMICRNLAKNARAEKMRHTPLQDLEAVAEAEEQSIEPELDIDRLLQALNEEERQLLQWARDGCSVSEMARKLGISYTAAGVRLHRIRKRLREFYG